MAARLSSVGHEVVVGSRSKYRAMEKVDALLAKWPDLDLSLQAGDNEDAAGCELVVIATPWDSAASTALSVADLLEGKVLIAMSNALAKVGDEFQPLVPPRGSVAAHIQATIPGAAVAAAFHHVPATELGDLRHPVESDVLVCSDRPMATDVASDLVDGIPDMRPLDAGGLSNAAPIEAFTAVLLQLNTRYKTRAAVKFTSIER